MLNSFYSEEELKELGLKAYGKNVLISRFARLYGESNIVIGNNVRIDDFCILSGKITMGNNIHISAYTGIFAGTAGVNIMDFSTISSRTAVYAISDDYSGNSMANPTVGEELRGVIEKEVVLEKHTLVGSGCTILPGVVIGEGTSVGSMSLVNKSLEPWGIYAGIPCKYLKERSKKLLELEKQMENI